VRSFALQPHLALELKLIHWDVNAAAYIHPTKFTIGKCKPKITHPEFDGIIEVKIMGIHGPVPPITSTAGVPNELHWAGANWVSTWPTWKNIFKFKTFSLFLNIYMWLARPI